MDFYLYLAAALVTIRQLIQRARKHYRSDTRACGEAAESGPCCLGTFLKIFSGRVPGRAGIVGGGR